MSDHKITCPGCGEWRNIYPGGSCPSCGWERPWDPIRVAEVPNVRDTLVALLVAYAHGDYDQGECEGIADTVLAAGWRAPLTPPCDRYCEPLACPRCGT